MNGAGDKAEAKERCVKKLFFDAQAYAVGGSDYTPNGSDGVVRSDDHVVTLHDLDVAHPPSAGCFASCLLARRNMEPHKPRSRSARAYAREGPRLAQEPLKIIRLVSPVVRLAPLSAKALWSEHTKPRNGGRTVALLDSLYGYGSLMIALVLSVTLGAVGRRNQHHRSSLIMVLSASKCRGRLARTKSAPVP